MMEHLNWFHAIITTTITHMHRHFAHHNSYSCRIRSVSSTPIAHKSAGVAGATAVQASSVITRTISNMNAGAATNYTYINASRVYCVLYFDCPLGKCSICPNNYYYYLCVVRCTTVHMIHPYIYASTLTLFAAVGEFEFIDSIYLYTLCETQRQSIVLFYSNSAVMFVRIQLFGWVFSSGLIYVWVIKSTANE